jgi:hypothetical protein
MSSTSSIGSNVRCPLSARGRCGVDDRASVRDPVEQRFGETTQGEVVDPDDHAGRGGVGDTGVVEQRVHRTDELGGRGVDRPRVGEIHLEITIMRTGRRLHVDHRDGPGAELGEHLDECCPDAGRGAGDDDVLALVAERIGHRAPMFETGSMSCAVAQM